MFRRGQQFRGHHQTLYDHNRLYLQTKEAERLVSKKTVTMRILKTSAEKTNFKICLVDTSKRPGEDERAP